MKHKLKYFMFLISIGLVINVSAQQTVFKTYFSIDSCDNGPFPFAIETKGGYIYTSNFSGIGNAYGLGLRKIDKNGLNSKFILIKGNDSFSPFITDMKLMESNKILLVGRNYWQKANKMHAYLMLIDTNLNIISEHNHIHRGYDNEIYNEVFYDYSGNLCTILKEYTYYLSPDSMYFSIQKLNTNNFSTTKLIEIKGYDPLQLIKTSDSGYLLYTFSPKYEKQYYTDPVIIKFDKNWNKLWEQNIGDYGKIESGGYGITRMVELNHQYYCWRTSGIIGEIGYLYRFDEAGKILNKWKEKDSSWFQTLINRGNDGIAFGNMNYYYKGDWRIALHIFDSNYNILKQNYIGFREFYDTCATPSDSTLYHMDAIKTMDGGFLIFNWGSSYSARGKVDPFGKNFDILFKTDSCGYTQGDTCKLVARIDSIKYNTVYLSLDELNHKVCGRRWYVDGKILTTDKLMYSFSDTGTYTIGIWGFAGATTDSTSIQVRITQLDSCNSNKTDICILKSDTLYINCNQVQFSINKPLSQYCSRFWIIEGNKFYQDVISYTYPTNAIYTSYLIGSRGLSKDTVAISVKINCPLSISASNISGEIDIYPNPASDFINVKLRNQTTIPSPKFDIPIILTNILGQSLPKSLKYDGKENWLLDVRNLNNGIYYLTFTYPKDVIFYKVIKIQH